LEVIEANFFASVRDVAGAMRWLKFSDSESAFVFDAADVERFSIL
jgi:hypothetical protein